MRRLINKQSTFSAVLGVEIQLLGKNGFQVRAVQLKREQQNLKLVNTYPATDNLEQLLANLPKGIPLAIVFTGKGVLQKKLINKAQQESNYLQQAIPNANSADFNYQIYPGRLVSWLAIVRKEVVEEWINQFTKLGYSILSINVGIPIVQAVLPIIQNQETPLPIGLYDLKIEQNEIIEINPRVGRPLDHLVLGNESLISDLLPAFSAAFQFLAGLKNPLINDHHTPVAIENYQYEQRFKLTGWIGLISIFLLLLANFLIFSWLNHKNQRLGAALSYHQQQLQQLDTLQATYHQRKAFFQQSSMMELSKTSFYADQIGYSVPEGIKLKKLQVFPMVGNTQREREKSWQFKSSEIYIKGNSKQSITLNNWIRTLENQNWVKQVEVLPYKENQDGSGEFELKLSLEKLRND